MTIGAPTRQVLTGPFATEPDPHGISVTPAVEHLVATQVQALLERSPAYYAISDDQRSTMKHDLTKIAAYSAALLHDGFGQAERLGQTPVLRERTVIERPAPISPPLARAAADQSAFAPRAVDRVAEVTRGHPRCDRFPELRVRLDLGDVRGDRDVVDQADGGVR